MGGEAREERKEDEGAKAESAWRGIWTKRTRAQPFEEPSPSLSKCSGPQWEYPEARTVFFYAHGAEARAN